MIGAGAFLRTIVDHLNECGIEFVVTGSFVSTFYGDARTTRDLDILVSAQEPPSESMMSFVSRCEADGLYVSTYAALGPTPQRRRSFNVIDVSSAWKADIMWIESRPFSMNEFARRRRVELMGCDVWIPSPEDIVLAKLEWGGSAESRQFDDAVSVLRVQGGRVDHSYLLEWAAHLGITALLQAALDQARPA